MISKTPEQLMAYNARLKFQRDEAARIEQAALEGEARGEARGERRFAYTVRLTRDYNGEAAPFEKALTETISRLMAQPQLLQQYGNAGRIRAQKLFGWDAVAALTVDLYRRVLA